MTIDATPRQDDEPRLRRVFHPVLCPELPIPIERSMFFGLQSQWRIAEVDFGIQDRAEPSAEMWPNLPMGRQSPSLLRLAWDASKEGRIPHLECPQASWRFLPALHDVLDALAARADQAFTPEDFCALLTKLGFEDISGEVVALA